MKVYVDELPKSCNDCKFRVFIAYTKNGWEHSERYCSIMKDNYDCKCSKENCPLQSLSDHDKQVRKEVCEEIQSELLDFTHKYWRVFNQNGKQYMTDDDLIECLNEIIDKIQGETK